MSDLVERMEYVRKTLRQLTDGTIPVNEAILKQAIAGEWMRVGEWQSEVAQLERALAAANAKIAAVDSIVWGVRTLVEYPADEGIRDIQEALEAGKVK